MQHPSSPLRRTVIVVTLLVACTCLFRLSAEAADAAGLVPYRNARFGYAVGYPGTFVPQGESENGDGQVFLLPGNQGEMRVYAAHNALGETLRQRYAESLKTVGGKAAYTALRAGWFVVSGVADGKIYYEKTVLAHGLFFTVALTYDPAVRETMGRLVGPIVASFHTP